MQWLHEFPAYAGGIVLEDAQGRQFPCQIIVARSVIPEFRSRVLFKAQIPAMGYKVFKVIQTGQPVAGQKNHCLHIQTPQLLAEIAPDTGLIQSIYFKTLQKTFTDILVPRCYEDTADTECFNTTVYGKPCEPFEARFNRNDYFENDDEQPVKLKLSFLDNGREVCSTEWSANIYPKFVRNNIDLSNSKNKYKNPEQFSIIEATLIDIMIANRQELIPLIVREICQACSFENADDYATTLKYGNKTYNLNIYKENSKYFRSLENAYRAKTNRYFKSIQ